MEILTELSVSFCGKLKQLLFSHYAASSCQTLSHTCAYFILSNNSLLIFWQRLTGRYIISFISIKFTLLTVCCSQQEGICLTHSLWDSITYPKIYLANYVANSNSNATLSCTYWASFVVYIFLAGFCQSKTAETSLAASFSKHVAVFIQ